MDVAVEVDNQIFVVFHLVQSPASPENAFFLAVAVEGGAGQGWAHVGEEDLRSGKGVRFEYSIYIFFEFLFGLVGVAIPDFIGKIHIRVARKGASKSNNTQTHFKDKLLLVNVEDIGGDVLLAVEVGEGIVVARDENDFALKEIVQKEENILTGFKLFLFIVGFFVVIAVDNITPNEAVVKMKGIAADSFC